MFWDKYVIACKKNNKSPSGLANELNINRSTVAGWKKGQQPAGNTVYQIAEKLNCSVDYLLSEDEEDVVLASKKSTFKSIHAIPQRFVSLISGDPISSDELDVIAEYLDCEPDFLKNTEEVKFKPLGKRKPGIEFNVNIMHEIFMILDRCADSKRYKSVQIQISRIILHWIFADEDSGWTIEKLYNIKQIDSHKLKYIYTNEADPDSTRNYGLNFTDLTVISRETKYSYQYLLTGTDGDVYREYKKLKEKLYNIK